MPDFPIPERAIGPGSQPPEDVEPDAMPLPRGINTFEMPHVPERVSVAAMRESAGVLQRMVDALGTWNAGGGSAGPRVALDALSREGLEVTNQVLGEGEVSIRLSTAPAVHIQESVFAGLWRCGELAVDGGLAHYWLEAGRVPQSVFDAARAADAPLVDPQSWPEGAMNSPALLAELRARLGDARAGGQGGQINLTLLPLSGADREAIDTAMPRGSVAILSRGFGHCEAGSTAVRGVWRVQFFNSMHTLILDTIEITEMPDAVSASAEDLGDSRTRLGELVRWMHESADHDEQQRAR